MNSRKIIQEIDSRLEKLGNHYHDKKDTENNPYGEMLAAESKLLNTALSNELRSLKEFIENDGK
ncbi:MAG: hypothetical protein J6K17_06165 [Oscillospiraceae bacterium]|nr:hypothetical protein [Oscillospiraceae bacterium]